MVIKGITLFLTIGLLTGCGVIAKQLDATWADNRTVYRQAELLPPLEVPAELAISKPIK